MYRRGDTFRSRVDGGHLWVILVFNSDDDKYLCVCFVTQKPYTDPTVVCQPGEHPSITVPTSVAYNFAEFFTEKRITDNLSGGSFTTCQPCTKALLDKVFNGVAMSDRTPKRILRRLDLLE